MADNLVECRSCLNQFGVEMHLFHIFQVWCHQWDNTMTTIADDLSRLANIQLSEIDGHSNMICSTCCEKLKVASEFVSMVRVNNEILQKKYNQSPMKSDSGDTVWPKPIQLDSTLVYNSQSHSSDCDIKQEVLSDDEYNVPLNYMDNEKGINLNDVDIKIEPEEMIAPGNIIGAVENLVENVPLANGHIRTGSDKNLIDPLIKEEPLSEDETDSCDLSLECILCGKVFKKISGLKAHVIAHHSYKTVRRKRENSLSPRKNTSAKFNCVTCRRKFTTSTDLMVHETCHKKVICYGCNQMFETFELLTKHRVRCKAIANREPQKRKTLDDVRRLSIRSPAEDVEVKKEKLYCLICDKQFDDEHIGLHNELHTSKGEDDQSSV